MVLLQEGDRYLYYLITKKDYDDKPLLHDLKRSLWSMKGHAFHNGRHEVSMPAIRTGLDRLRWASVQERIRKVFEHSGVHISVYWQKDQDKEASRANEINMIRLRARRTSRRYMHQTH